MGIVASRASWREIFCGKRGLAAKKKKGAKKPVETDAPDGNPQRTRISPVA
jgi:hypothetical protein